MRERAKGCGWGLILCVAVMSSGCTTGGSAVETRQAALETIRLTPVVEEGGEVELTLTNGTSRLIGANLCRARVEVHQGEGAWEEQEVPLVKDCVNRHETLAPGGQKVARFSSEEWPEGDLRFHISVEYPMGIGFESIRSQGFRVEAEEDVEEPELEEPEVEEVTPEASLPE